MNIFPISGLRFYDLLIMWSPSDLDLFYDMHTYCQIMWNNEGKMLKKQLKSRYSRSEYQVYNLWVCVVFISLLIKIYWWLQL